MLLTRSRLFDTIFNMNEKEEIESYKNAYLQQIGELDENLHPICEMAHIVTYNKMRIWVWPREGLNKPHFHIGDLNYGKQWRSSIRIDCDEYFLHDNDILLNAKRKKQLMEMLTAAPDDKDDPFKTNWEKIIYQWNQVPGVKKISRDLPIRDYEHNLPNIVGTKKPKVK